MEKLDPVCQFNSVHTVWVVIIYFGDDHYVNITQIHLVRRPTWCEIQVLRPLPGRGQFSRLWASAWDFVFYQIFWWFLPGHLRITMLFSSWCLKSNWFMERAFCPCTECPGTLHIVRLSVLFFSFVASVPVFLSKDNPACYSSSKGKNDLWVPPWGLLWFLVPGLGSVS